ncbi:MAG: sulfatase-like hydrolase/transferase [Lentisphaerae bacterium]|nr:sulfatase-like hydrolase/transferase [Lentisphaerota bacterium]
MATRTQPNILVCFTDQQRADTIAALGNPVIRTPALDRLCASGVAFTNAFSPSPVCISARCSMIHGQYPWHTGCYENTRMPTDGRETYMAALTTAGYRTHGIGKCHFSPDPLALRGFETREVQEEIVRDPASDDYLRFLHERGFRHVADPHGIRGEMYYVPQPSQAPAELHPTHWVGDRAVAFLRDQAGQQRPWCLFASFIHPHPPFAVPNPWHKLYRAPLMPLPNVPPDSEALLTYINRLQSRYKYRDQGTDRNLLRCLKAYYYASISFVDAQIGRILATLEATGQLDRTVILFTSDHGELLGDYNAFGKRSMHDACARIPMLLSWPGRLAGGQVCNAPVSLVDVAPTLCAAAGTRIGSHALDGLDLASIAEGTARREAVFAQHAVIPPVAGARDLHDHPESRAALSTYMAVSRDWKYVYSATDHREFLFDRRSDPAETRNRAGLGLCREPLQALRAALVEELRAAGETGGLQPDGSWREFPRLALSPDPDAHLLVQDHPWADTRIPGYTNP